MPLTSLSDDALQLVVEQCDRDRGFERMPLVLTCRALWRAVAADDAAHDLRVREHEKRGEVSFLKCMPPVGGEDTCYEAACNGHLGVLQWARSNGWSWCGAGNKVATQAAAQNGHLNIVQWARAQGCPWDDTCVEAALHGHLGVMQWALANGCPWSSDATYTPEELCGWAATWALLPHS